MLGNLLGRAQSAARLPRGGGGKRIGFIPRRHETPAYVVLASLMSFASHAQLERMADQATNVAEDVVFLVEGNLIRHGAKRSVAS